MVVSGVLFGGVLHYKYNVAFFGVFVSCFAGVHPLLTRLGTRTDLSSEFFNFLF